MFTSFALATDVGAGTEADIAAVQPRELRDPQAGLDAHEQQRPVTSAFPARTIGSVDEGIDLRGVEKGDN